MPGTLLHVGATVLCTHGGQAQPTAPNPRVMIMGVPVPMSAPPVLIAGCPFPPPPVANGPCVSAPWIPVTHTVRVKSNNLPLVCQSSQAIAVPTGTPIVIAFAGQTRVQGM